MRLLPLLLLLILATCAATPPPKHHTVALPMVSGYSPNKLGVAGTNMGLRVDNCTGMGNLGSGWYYEWSPVVPMCPGRNWEAVPMLWGAAQVGQPLTGNSPWLLGFNEPDLPRQANITPTKAATLWRKVEALYPNRLLVAPVPSDRGLWWLKAWYAAYVTAYGQPPRMHALAMHCYGQRAADCMALVNEYTALAQAWNVGQVWLTEFAFMPKFGPAQGAEAWAFTQWLEANPLVTRYSPYVSWQDCSNGTWDCAASGNPSLFERDGRLSELGLWYARW
jgi:hypothetical protein